MKIKGIMDECFSDYKKAAMYIAFPNCSFKCDQLNRCSVCQNSKLAHEPDIDITKEEIIARYLKNPITKAVILSGLEPFDSILDLIAFVDAFRKESDDDIVIYTGYTEEELKNGHYGNEDVAPATMVGYYNFICGLKNVIIKYGRYVMDDESHYDEVLGVNLASHNQYAKGYN